MNKIAMYEALLEDHPLWSDELGKEAGFFADRERIKSAKDAIKKRSSLIDVGSKGTGAYLASAKSLKSKVYAGRKSLGSRVMSMLGKIAR